MTRTVVLVFDHFAPDFSAGGPITSLVNLASVLSAHTPVRVITSANQYRPAQRLNGVVADQWSTFDGVSVWYATDTASVDQAIASLPPESILYLNGLFSPTYFFRVARLAKKANLPIVVSPRGMLQPGALRGKYWKKFIYLKVVKGSRALKGATWHATDEQERGDIQQWFGQVPVVVAPNIPRSPLERARPLEKTKGALKLVYFSLITEKKNLLFLLKVLSNKPIAGLTLDIVGPIKDVHYWKECEPFVDGTTIKYAGERTPDQVLDTLSSYHASVLPTRGENYGHAIIESLCAWRPILISEFTPWTDLGDAGCALPLEESKWHDTLQRWVNWSQFDFDQASEAAIGYFRRHVNMNQLSQQYIDLFSAAR